MFLEKLLKTVFCLLDYHWVDHDRIGDLMKQATMEQAIAAGNGTEEKNKTDEDAVEGALEDDDSSSGERRRGYDEQIRSMPNVVLQLREEDENNGRRFQPLQEEEQDHWGEDEEEESHNLSPHIMSGQEIMHKYWKLVVRIDVGIFNVTSCNFVERIQLEHKRFFLSLHTASLLVPSSGAK